MHHGRVIKARIVGYRKVWLISACAYHFAWQGNMPLLDDVRLIDREVVAPPTASTFERSITKLASYEHSDSWTKLCNSSWEYDRKPSLEENERLASVKVKSPNPSQWNIAVLSILL